MSCVHRRHPGRKGGEEGEESERKSNPGKVKDCSEIRTRLAAGLADPLEQVEQQIGRKALEKFS